MTEKKTAEPVIEYVKLTPTALISLECSACAHPFRTRSHEAMDAARSDHFGWLHSAALAEVVAGIVMREEEE